MKKDSEDYAQILLVNWIRRALGDDIWSKTHHSPGGGSRSAREGAKFKLMGVRPGFPDLVTYVARGGFAGLVVELKVKGRKARTDQLEWQDILEACGFCVHICDGFEGAKFVYRVYFNYTGDIE